MPRRIKIISLSAMALCLVLSCADPVKIVIPDETVYPVSGTAAIDSRLIGDLRMGFRFAIADTIYYPNNNLLYPDIAARISSGGSVIEFFAVEVRPAFKLMYSSTDPDSAEVYFDSLKTLTDTSGFATYGANVMANQVWAVRTNIARYAKIVVKSALIDTVAKVSFDWVYQPDNSLPFTSK